MAFTWDKVKPAPVKDTSAKKDTLKSKEAVAAAVKNEQEPAQAVKTAEAVKDSVKKKPVEKKSDGKKLTIANPLTGRTLDYEHVVEYAVSDKSDVMAFVVTEKDSVETSLRVPFRFLRHGFRNAGILRQGQGRENSIVRRRPQHGVPAFSGYG